MATETREATNDDVDDLARMRARMHAEPTPAEGLELADYRAGFARWWAAQDGRRRAVIALDGPHIVGMGFLVLVDRVPVPDALVRRHGDVQSMYVVPEHRGRGVGSGILRALVDLARESGCSRVEVHANRRAVSLYERSGFQPLAQLMSLDLGE